MISHTIKRVCTTEVTCLVCLPTVLCTTSRSRFLSWLLSCASTFSWKVMYYSLTSVLKPLLDLALRQALCHVWFATQRCWQLYAGIRSTQMRCTTRRSRLRCEMIRCNACLALTHVQGSSRRTATLVGFVFHCCDEFVADHTNWQIYLPWNSDDCKCCLLWKIQ